MILSFRQIFTVLLLFFYFSKTSAQVQTKENITSKDKSHTFFNTYRANNVITGALGTAVINGDYQDPLFEFYAQIGYKRYITPYVNINFTYNKFNLAYRDISNNGYMSFDLNVEGTIMPNNFFTPFVFAGAGFNAANYFKEIGIKIQGGLGIEYIVMEGLGLKLFTDYNHTFSDELDGKVYGEANDIYWRIGFGVNYYFGNSKKKSKIPSDEPTIINSNPIIHK